MESPRLVNAPTASESFFNLSGLSNIRVHQINIHYLANGFQGIQNSLQQMAQLHIALHVVVVVVACQLLLPAAC